MCPALFICTDGKSREKRTHRNTEGSDKHEKPLQLLPDGYTGLRPAAQADPLHGVQLSGLLRWKPRELLPFGTDHRREVFLLRKRRQGCPADPGGSGPRPKGVQLPGEPLWRPPADQQQLLHPPIPGLLRERGAPVRGGGGTAPVRPASPLCGTAGIRTAQPTEDKPQRVDRSWGGFGRGREAV